MQKLTNEKARELLKELQYAKVQMGGQLSIRDEYFKQALERVVGLDTLLPPKELRDFLFKTHGSDDYIVQCVWNICTSDNNGATK